MKTVLEKVVPSSASPRLQLVAMVCALPAWVLVPALAGYWSWVNPLRHLSFYRLAMPLMMAGTFCSITSLVTYPFSMSLSKISPRDWFWMLAASIPLVIGIMALGGWFFLRLLDDDYD